MSFIQRSSGEEVNVVRPLTSLLRSVVSHFEEVVDLNLLTSMLRSEEDSVTQSKSLHIQNACLRPEFDLDIIQMEVEGEENRPTDCFCWKMIKPHFKSSRSMA